MLKSLLIKNFVLIDNLDIKFDKGFSVITGETGAGKSIILGALSLVLGARADAKSIKGGTDKCVIEAVFDVSQYKLEEFFLNNDLEYDNETCILRRELFASGKSRAFVNDSPVSLAVMKDLGTRLIDVHSQHQNLLLGNNTFQMKVLDVVAENEIPLILYKKEFRRYQSLKRELKQLTEKALKTKQEADYVKFQFDQLDSADLKSGEQIELEEELEMLNHAEDIKLSLYKIAGLLDGEEIGILSMLKEASGVANQQTSHYQRMQDVSERLSSAYIDLNDLASEVESMKEDIEYDPERLEWVNQRLDTIYSLEQKHHVQTIEELIAIRDALEVQLEEIDSFDEQIDRLNSAIKESHDELMQQATVLSEQRKEASKAISAQLVKMVSPLGMPNTKFEIEFTKKSEPDVDGIDDIRFMFSANKNSPLQPVANIASGGEISRLMLCIKTLIAGFTALPTIIFDEVDTGVSGDIADKMADIMQVLGNRMQVITITHLPQIAAKGKSHFFVYKEDISDGTITRMRTLDKDERIKEIARMLSGATLTEASIANAKDLLGDKD
jgi:DNA repair protein RecN (Recombination protein N)